MKKFTSQLIIAAAACCGVSLAFLPASVPTTSFRVSTPLHMGLDYKDPVVAAEFEKVQPMTYEDVEAELKASGIPYSQSMKLRLSGDVGAKPKKEKPATFKSSFEEAMWTKPAFEKFFNDLKEKDDHNSQNVVTEYMQNKDLALERYGKTYKGLLRRLDTALNAPPPVTSPTIKFSGFPANMGEDACRMTLEAVGPVSGFSCETDEDFPILRGEVTFEDIETAKKAVAQYNGMSMGMGAALELVSV